jgi:hypothetical protein
MPAYDPNNYVTVAERLNVAHGLIQTIVAEPPVMLTDVMGYIRVVVALSDGRSSTGTASFRLDLTGGRAQATNPIEDCETSAIGRALGMLGFGSRDGIASREEVVEARHRAEHAGASFDDAGATPQCPTHHKAMKPGKSGGWFCPTKDEQGNWCKHQIKQTA